MKKIDILPGKENLFYNEVGKHPIFVKFYMDGCPHCENMKQDWIDMENELLNNYSGDLTLMSVNARALNTLKSPLTSQVNGFPTIFIIKKDGSKGLDFQGDRNKDEMLKFILSNSSVLKKQGLFQTNKYIHKVKKQKLRKNRTSRRIRKSRTRKSRTRKSRTRKSRK
jgi:thiol-disulfide isomerase/thioredoxin